MTNSARSPMPWVSFALALLSAGLWSLAYGNLIGGVPQVLVDCAAGPAAVAGLIVGIVATIRRKPPRSIGVLGIVLGVLATAYIAIEFMRVLAVAAFA